MCSRGRHGPIAKSLNASMLARPAPSLARDALLFGYACHFQLRKPPVIKNPAMRGFLLNENQGIGQSGGVWLIT